MRGSRRFEDLPASVKRAVCKADGTYDRIEAAVAEREEKAEKKLQYSCECMLRQFNILFIHLRKDVKFFPDAPDFRFGINGYDIAVELKTESGKQTKGQIDYMQKLQDAGTFCYVIRDVDTLIKIINFFQSLPKVEDVIEQMNFYCASISPKIKLQEWKNKINGYEFKKNGAKTNVNRFKIDERIEE